MDWECSASRLALARDRSAADGLDPSAFPVCLVCHSVGALRRRPAKKGSPLGRSCLTTGAPYKAPPTRAAPSLVRALRGAHGSLLFATWTTLSRAKTHLTGPH